MDRTAPPKEAGTLDAYDFLKRQGWRGLGYSLDQSDRGIARPVLYSHKSDNSGLGTKKSLVADQWWMRAFDSSLKDLGTGNKSALAQAREQGVSKGGLYGFFVKGRGLEGTLTAHVELNRNHHPLLNQSSTSQSASSKESESSQSSVSIGPASESERETSVLDSASMSDSAENIAPTGNTNPLKRKREPKPSRHEVRKRRREERTEKQRRGIAEKREQQIADGTYDWEAEKERNKVKDLNRKLASYIKKCEREGMFTKEALLQYEAEQKAAKRADRLAEAEAAGFQSNEGINADRLAMINGDGEASVPDKNLSYKAEKLIRERRKRDLKRDERARLVKEMWPNGIGPSDEGLSLEEIKEKRQAEKEEKRRRKQEKEAFQKAKMQERAREQAERAAAKKARREERLKQQEEARSAAASKIDGQGSQVNGSADPTKTKKELAKERKLALKQIKQEQAPDGNEDELNGDIIKLDDSWDFHLPDEETRAISYPNNMTAAQYMAHLVQASRQKAIEVHALLEQLRAKGDSLTPEERKQLRSEEDSLKEQAAVREYAMKMGLPESFAPPIMDLPGTTDSEPAPQAPAPKELSAKKKAKYAARAAEKGMSVEDYIARREVKNAEKKNAGKKDAAPEPAPEPSDAMEVDDGASLGFIVDTAGDSGLAPPAEMVEIPAAFGKLELPLNPLIWEGRKVKLLTKAERKARLEYLRIRRAVRQHKRVPTMTAKERRKKRVDMKLDMQNQLGRQLLQSEGANTKDLTPNEMKDARRRAKRMLRAAKKGKEVEGLPEEMRAKVDKKARKQKQKLSRGGRNN